MAAIATSLEQRPMPSWPVSSTFSSDLGLSCPASTERSSHFAASGHCTATACISLCLSTSSTCCAHGTTVNKYSQPCPIACQACALHLRCIPLLKQGALRHYIW